MTTGQLKNQPHCPGCNHLLDGLTGVDHDRQPSPGDVTICAYCNEVLQFTDDMSLKLAPPEVIEECGLLQISRGQRQARAFNAKVTLAKKIREVVGGRK